MKAGTGEITNENARFEDEHFTNEESVKLFKDIPGLNLVNEKRDTQNLNLSKSFIIYR